MTTTDTAFDSPALDHFADDAGMERPERTEDRVDRDRWGKPRILPLGESMPTTEAARKRARAEHSTLNEQFRRWLADYEREANRKAASDPAPRPAGRSAAAPR